MTDVATSALAVIVSAACSAVVAYYYAGWRFRRMEAER